MNVTLFSPNSVVLEVKYKDYANLSRLTKGYFYEMLIQSTLDRKHISYSGNPKQYEEWTKYTNTGYDIRVKTHRGLISVEAKFTLTKIAHSWFNRDWLSRSASIFVTNDKYNVSYRDRRTLEKLGKKLLNTDEFKVYIDKLLRVTTKLNAFSEKLNVLTNYIVRMLSSILKLDKWIEKGGLSIEKTEKKGQLPNCHSCKRRGYCDILKRIEDSKCMKPKKEGVQSNLFTVESTVSYRDKKKEWLRGHIKIVKEQDKCLNKRSYLQDKKGYDLFEKE